MLKSFNLLSLSKAVRSSGFSFNIRVASSSSSSLLRLKRPNCSSNNYFSTQGAAIKTNTTKIRFNSSHSLKMPSALVLLAKGAEEIETVTIVDVLRRAQIDVTVAGLDGADVVTCSRGVKILPDCALSSVVDHSFDIVILPGGAEGSKHLSESKTVGKILHHQVQADKHVGTICAATTALAAHHVFHNYQVTSYPSFKDKLTADYKYSESRVCTDRKLITSRGPGTAMEFAVEIIHALCGAEKAKSVADPMLMKH